MGSITVWLTCLTFLDWTKLVNLYLIQQKQSGWILTGQTGGQPYSNTSPYKVSECSLDQYMSIWSVNTNGSNNIQSEAIVSIKDIIIQTNYNYNDNAVTSANNRFLLMAISWKQFTFVVFPHLQVVSLEAAAVVTVNKETKKRMKKQTQRIIFQPKT